MKRFFIKKYWLIKYFAMNIVFAFVICVPIYYILKILVAIKDEIFMHDREIIDAIIQQNRINKKVWENINKF